MQFFKSCKVNCFNLGEFGLSFEILTVFVDLVEFFLIPPLKFLCSKQLILLSEVGSLGEKISHLEQHSSGDIILARELDY